MGTACQASFSILMAPARAALNRCASGAITRSAAATTYQDRSTFQAAADAFASNADAVIGR